MIPVAELRTWLNAEEEDVPTLFTLERAAVAAAQEITGMYLGPSTVLVEGEATAVEVVETVHWSGGILVLSNEPIGDVTLEQWDGAAWAAIEASAFYVDGALLRFNTRPTGTGTRYRATYQAGYTADADDADVWDAPEDIKQAVRMLVGSWWRIREGLVTGTIVAEVPYGIELLLRAHKRTAF